jgi:hypothetical protein
MKTHCFKFVILVIITWSPFALWSQSIHIKHPIDSAALSQKIAEPISPAKNIAYYDAFISALEIKIQAVQSNPVAHQEALNSGWYTQINYELLKAKEEREALLQEE